MTRAIIEAANRICVAKMMAAAPVRWMYRPAKRRSGNEAYDGAARRFTNCIQSVPTGVDIVKVVRTGILPILHTGIAHKQPGIGQIGTGVLRAPMACLTQALRAFTQRYGA